MKINQTKLKRRAKGKLVVIGFDVDRVAGIFSTMDKAMEALQEAQERYDHNWWMEFRRLDRLEKPSIFERILVRTQVASSNTTAGKA